MNKLALIPLAFLVGCAAPAMDSKTMQSKYDAMMKAGFQARGIATLARLDQDEAQKVCSDQSLAEGKAGEGARKRVEEINLASIKWPSDAVYLGDWKLGEAIAQSGRGLTWSDSATQVNGGNCYNCHQIDKAEISSGTIGPSLWNYGKIRGVTNPLAPASAPVVQYTWGKIWNAKAYNACSNMPRAGHMGILTEVQVRHVMALLLDPKSPVNQ